MDKQQLKLEIKEMIEKSIRNFFEDKEVKVNHILDLIFPNERRIRSLIGGLETSFGTTLWEPLAKLLSKKNGFIILDEKQFKKPVEIPQNISLTISKWKDEREKKNANIELTDFIKEIRQGINSIDLNNIEYEKITKGKGVDIWLKKNGVEYLFDIKTNQINAGAGLKHNETLMDWYAYRILQKPDVDIQCKIAFPFNPFVQSWWDKMGGRAYPLRPGTDAVVENEFWDFLSGFKNTWEIIHECFKELGDENFGQKFEDIFYKN